MSIANPTPTLSLERQIVGSNSNTWGDRENANWARLDQSQRSVTVDVSGGAVTLSQADTADTAADAQTRFLYIGATGTPTAPATVTWPTAVVKLYVLANATAQPVTFKVAGQTGVILQPGATQVAFCSSDLFAVGISASAITASLASEAATRAAQDAALSTDYIARIAAETTARGSSNASLANTIATETTNRVNQANAIFSDYVARDNVLSAAKLNKHLFARSLPGYAYFADTGFVIQWGSGVAGNNGHYNGVVFPVSFPTACYSVVVTEANSSGWESGGDSGTPTLYGVGDLSAGGFALSAVRWESPNWIFRGTAYNYIAVGG